MFNETVELCSNLSATLPAPESISDEKNLRKITNDKSLGIWIQEFELFQDFFAKKPLGTLVVNFLTLIIAKKLFLSRCFKFFFEFCGHSADVSPRIEMDSP